MEEWISQIFDYLWLLRGYTEIHSAENKNGKWIGDLLLEPICRNRIHVKGIYVQDLYNKRNKDNQIPYIAGFNVDVELNRDRNYVYDYSYLKSLTSEITTNIINKNSKYLLQSSIYLQCYEENKDINNNNNMDKYSILNNGKINLNNDFNTCNLNNNNNMDKYSILNNAKINPNNDFNIDNLNNNNYINKYSFLNNAKLNLNNDFNIYNLNNNNYINKYSILNKAKLNLNNDFNIYNLNNNNNNINLSINNNNKKQMNKSYKKGKNDNDYLIKLPSDIIQCLSGEFALDEREIESYLTEESEEIFWNEMNKNKNLHGKQPTSNENYILQFLSDKKLEKDFYKYYVVSNELIYCLQKSKHYISIENKYSQYIQTIKTIEPKNDYLFAISDIISRRKLLKRIFLKNKLLLKNLKKMSLMISIIWKRVYYILLLKN